MTEIICVTGMSAMTRVLGCAARLETTGMIKVRGTTRTARTTRTTGTTRKQGKQEQQQHQGEQGQQ